jgi:hypothetical protein
MCSHESCKHKTHYIINSVQYCKNHVPMDLGICKVIKRDGKECGCIAKISSKGINTCLTHVPKSSEVETCSICLDDCNIGTKSTVCGHFFHPKCLKEWKNQPAGHTCPVCRFELSKPRINDEIFQRVTIIAREASDAEEFINAIIDQIDPIHVNFIMSMIQSN